MNEIDEIADEFQSDVNDIALNYLAHNPVIVKEKEDDIKKVDLIHSALRLEGRRRKALPDMLRGLCIYHRSGIFLSFSLQYTCFYL